LRQRERPRAGGNGGLWLVVTQLVVTEVNGATQRRQVGNANGCDQPGVGPESKGFWPTNNGWRS